MQYLIVVYRSNDPDLSEDAFELPSEGTLFRAASGALGLLAISMACQLDYSKWLDTRELYGALLLLLGGLGVAASNIRSLMNIEEPSTNVFRRAACHLGLGATGGLVMAGYMLSDRKLHAPLPFLRSLPLDQEIAILVLAAILSAGSLWLGSIKLPSRAELAEAERLMVETDTE